MAALPRLVLAGLALVLGTDGFLVYGARVVHPVAPRAAVARFRARPGASVAAGPRAGVYVYDTTGYSDVDRLGTHRRYPRVTARIVRGRGCGWREEVPVFREHVETYDHCGATESGFATRLTYFLVPSVTSLACDAGTCRGDGVTATLTVTRDGPGSAVVGGVRVACRRVTVTTVLRGSSTGGAVRRLCLDGSGLVLTEERSVGIVARSAFVGRVTYTERATFALTSLEPLT